MQELQYAKSDSENHSCKSRWLRIGDTEWNSGSREQVEQVFSEAGNIV